MNPMQKLDQAAILEPAELHFFHADPGGDVVLRSNDSILFRTNGWQLAKAR
jgi:hypothetical protein